MADARLCPDCHSPLPSRTPEGLCPRCLLAAGMAHSASAPGGGLLDTIAATLGGSVPRVLLRDTNPGEDPSPLVQPTSREMPAAPGRLQLFGEIARGGMGAVLKGRDPDLGRELAVKVLLEGHRDNPDLVRRFVEEAQIAGQLQHPGVAPVYEMGQFADARPYFSMKLVKGHTLAEVLASRAGPADGLSGHVATWLQVCQTVAYAHARGVIHRDLKPSNIMLGGFGEVQVMDWGLAKVLSRGGIADDATAGKRSTGETVIATARSGEPNDDLSRFGSILGTPSYMAPEQARGETDVVDERADVFALGSILCEVLTGRPAFTGRTSAEIQRKAARGDTAEALASLDACGADAELVELARSCLSPREDDRPHDAGVVAARGSAYTAAVEAKLRRAELRSVEERARHRLTTLGAAATILLMLIGGGGYFWGQRQKSERIARTTRAVDAALADAARLRGEALAAPPGDVASWAAAVSAAKQAEGLLAQGEADTPLRDRVATLLAQLDREQADAAEKARQLEADRVLLAALDAIRGNSFGEWDPKRTDTDYAAAFRAAGLDLDTEPAEVGRRLASRSEPVELAGHLDEWAFVRQRTDRPEADWQRLIAAARAADPDPWREAIRARFGSRNAAAIAEYRRIADDEAMLTAQPASSLLLLARQLKHIAKDRERAARVLRRAAFRHPGDFSAQIELASVHGASGGSTRAMYPQPEESIRHLTAAVAIRPKSSWAHLLLGVALRAQNKPDEAMAEVIEAVRLQPNSAFARNSLGIEFGYRSKFNEAIAEYREAIRLQADYLNPQPALRHALKASGKVAETVAECREAVRSQPDSVGLRMNLAIALEVQGNGEEAIDEYRAAIRIRPDYTPARINLSTALKARGKQDEALAEYREVIRLKPNSAGVRAQLGDLLQAEGKHDQAIAEYRAALRLRPDDPVILIHLGVSLDNQGQPEEAAAQYREAIRIAPDGAGAHGSLGAALFKQGKLDEAVAEFCEDIRLNPNSAWAHDWVGFVLAAQGKHDQAIAEYRAAIRLQPNYIAAHNNLFNSLKAQGKLNEAVAEFREMVRLRPVDANNHVNLGFALKTQGKLEEARAAYQTAQERTKAGTPAATRIAEDIRAVDRLIFLNARLPAVLSRAEAPHDAVEGLAFADLCYGQGRQVDATRLYADAFALDPKLADDLQRTYRYDAACCAALAGCGRGREEPPPDEAARARLRDQARAWLAADRDAWARRLDGADAKDAAVVAAQMRHCKRDVDLAGIREADGLAALPSAEAEAWRVLWADVDALLQRAEARSR